MSYVESIGQDFEWKLYDYDQPSDLKGRLRSYGFRIEEAEAIVVLDLEDVPEFFWQPVPHDVQRIHDPQKLVDVQSVEQPVWDEDSSWVLYFLGNALDNYPDQMSVYVACNDEQPAISYACHWKLESQESRIATCFAEKYGLIRSIEQNLASEVEVKFAKWIYRIAGIYGVLIFIPLLFLEHAVSQTSSPAITHPEYCYGFLITGLVRQEAFLIISNDPQRFRIVMPATWLEKSYRLITILLYVQNRISSQVLALGLIDWPLGALYVCAYAVTIPNRVLVTNGPDRSLR